MTEKLTSMSKVVTDREDGRTEKQAEIEGPRSAPAAPPPAEEEEDAGNDAVASSAPKPDGPVAANAVYLDELTKEQQDLVTALTVDYKAPPPR